MKEEERKSSIRRNVHATHEFSMEYSQLKMEIGRTGNGEVEREI